MNGAKNSTWAVDASRSTAEFSIRCLTGTKTSGAFGEVGGGNPLRGGGPLGRVL